MNWNAYLRWLRAQPCTFPGCGKIGGEAHHIRGIGLFGGTALKAPDVLAMPICREHHHLIHHTTDRQVLFLQYEMLHRTLRAAVTEGVLILHDHYYRPFVNLELGKALNPAPVEEGTYSGIYRDWLIGLAQMAAEGAVEVCKPRMRA